MRLYILFYIYGKLNDNRITRNSFNLYTHGVEATVHKAGGVTHSAECDARELVFVYQPAGILLFVLVWKKS